MSKKTKQEVKNAKKKRVHFEDENKRPPKRLDFTPLPIKRSTIAFKSLLNPKLFVALDL